ncbi:unnamed protein product [Gongylonema pulchrum]|uniref:Nuclear cap-binding protein subunit 1 n=1 Tax=Gongylonema pulchrum TaxID=637853 RepID=A0A183E094_9BILA|nr:unnamed protein product [Gongylonema pulchrum]
MILEVIFSQLMRLPDPASLPLFYGSIILELCKTKNMPQRIATMHMTCVDRFVDWFSYHMSNFEYRWSWADWDDCLVLNQHAPKRYFVKEVIEKCMRFSYREKISECLPDSFEEIAPEYPLISYSVDEEERSVKELVAQIENAFRNKATPEELTEILQEFSRQEGSGALTALSTFFAVLLNSAKKTFSHNFAAMTKYHV